PFRVPEPEDLRERLEAVLDAIYAAFSEGWSDPAGTETRRRELGAEALYLGRLVASLMPDEPEALGLLALMLHAAAPRANTCRWRRRTAPSGTRGSSTKPKACCAAPARWDRSAATSSRPRCSRPMPRAVTAAAPIGRRSSGSTTPSSGSR